jgi:hypothetical protein
MIGNSFEDEEVVFRGETFEFKVFVNPLNAGAVVTYLNNGVFTSSIPTFLFAGEYFVEARIERPNYKTQYMEATLTILPREHALGEFDLVVFTNATGLVFGDALPKIEAVAFWVNLAGVRFDIEGDIAFVAGQSLRAGYLTYQWRFVPNDSLNYVEVLGEINILVERARQQAPIHSESLENIRTVRDVQSIVAQLVSDPQNADKLTIVFICHSSGNQFNVSAPANTSRNAGMGFTQTNNSARSLSGIPTAPGTYTMLIMFDGDENIIGFTATQLITIQREVPVMLYIGIGVGVGFLTAIAAMVVIFKKRKI